MLPYHKFIEEISLQAFTDIIVSQNCSYYVTSFSICKAQGGDFAFHLWHKFLFNYFVPALPIINLFITTELIFFCFLGGAGTRCTTILVL